MTIIWCSVQSRHLSGGRKRQTLSTDKYALPKGAVKPSEIKASPQPVGAPQGSYLPPSLPIESICWRHSSLLLQRLRKFSGGCSMSGGSRDSLIKELMCPLI